LKTARHEKIIELISQYEIDTQEELAARLKEAGFNVTQATVSRDIRALKMTKVSGRDGKSYYAILKDSNNVLADKYTRVLNEALTSMDVGANLLVIHTVPGMAMGVGAALDAMNWEEILGSIAGDDTVMCACRTSEDASSVMVRLKTILKETRK
jgi:transcriptional regulator of arginine metabolism